MALKGTEGSDAPRPPSSIDAIIPGRSAFWRLATVTSTVNTRLRASAPGEMLVTLPEHWAASFWTRRVRDSPRRTRPRAFSGTPNVAFTALVSAMVKAADDGDASIPTSMFREIGRAHV